MQNLIIAIKAKIAQSVKNGIDCVNVEINDLEKLWCVHSVFNKGDQYQCDIVSDTEILITFIS